MGPALAQKLKIYIIIAPHQLQTLTKSHIKIVQNASQHQNQIKRGLATPWGIKK